MKLATLAAILGSTAAFAPAQTGRSPTAVSETKADLEVLAKKLNPIVPFFDPLGLADQEFWGESNEATIGFLRESEVKHGRIAMFAFVGYIVHANGITWPWAMTLAGDPFPKVSSAPEAWDAIPESAKLQIVLFIGFLEYWREVASGTHYMKGGKIGYFPPFDAKYIPGGALNLYNPFPRKDIAVMTDADKERRLVSEINNGRLAMIGIFGFISEGAVEGSVPALKGIIPHYDGDFMAPFATNFFPTP
mmetsp:Transcript_28506/g.59942  ORF Transcript_28506/g.59942 Transcript_28506/m.59942 type:complete len:248 (-) Transcript_28506:331-1074(-)|eukprot:CAMPEP_0171335858 /NCGR_PEP_ID=MMETSP0878-20121228/5616_1 /TAXON_ID=67004 /ORGANISM="Thalassiosira weissflogii, Strain CCMP1336" /LENGTH=247 /DNA_ID=CAMNT_0011837187 /DNA_START=133 /DNA_END=876 /DNA_ORIENTATION=-